IKSGWGHGRLEVEAQPFLNAKSFELFAALGEIHKQYEIKNNGGSQDGIAAQEIDFDLHGITQPSEDVDIVPTLFVITTRRIIVNANLMGEIAIQVGVKIGLKNVLQNGQFRFFFRLERSWIFQHFSVAIA